MKRSDELRLEISEKKTEIENLQKEMKIKDALKAADDLERLLDELKIETAKEKSDLENFLKTATPLNSVEKSEYHKAFFNAARRNFKNSVDPILLEGTDPSGGYLVPTEMNDSIVQELENENIMRQLATVIQTTSTHQIPVVVNKPSATWISETQNIAPSDETFTQLLLGAHKMAISIKISNELLQDSHYNLESFFVEQFVQSMARCEEDAFINGESTTDTSMPTGFLTTLSADSDAFITPSDSTNIANHNFDFDDVIRLIHALPRPYRKKACFLCNDATVQKLRRTKDNTQNYMWTPSTVAGEPDKLFGFPIFTSQFFPTATTTDDIVMAFGDFSKYYIADRATRIFKPLRELYALQDISCFLMIERVDGLLIDRQAIKLLKLR